MSHRTATVRHGNVYIANRHLPTTIRRLLKGSPTYVTLNEAGRVLTNPAVRRLLTRLGYRTYVAPYGSPRGRTDVMVLVHKRATDLGLVSVLLMEARPNVSAAWHDRHLVAALADDPVLGKVAVVAIHPSPAPEALRRGPATNPLVKAYADGMDRTETSSSPSAEAGYRVIITGDVQIRPDAPEQTWSRDAHAPRRRPRRRRLRAPRPHRQQHRPRGHARRDPGRHRAGRRQRPPPPHRHLPEGHPMTAQPWQTRKYPGRVDDVVVTSDGTQRITLTPPPIVNYPEREVRPHPIPDPEVPRRRLRDLLRPARTRQRDQLLARYRWANAGLRERLREEVTGHDATLDSVQAQADEWARTLGHAHPLVVGLRSTVAQGRVR